MTASTEASLAAIFHRLAEFLRKTGELGIFDTLVHNYRLKESLSLSDENLQKFINHLQLLISTIQNFINSNAQSQVSADFVKTTDTLAVPQDIQPVENSIEINPSGDVSKMTMVQELPNELEVCLSRPKINEVDVKRNSSKSQVQVDLVGCKDKRFICEFCQLKNVLPLLEFDSLQLLNKHKRIAHPVSKCHFCNQCDLSFQSHQSLQKHKRRKHPSKKEVYSCSVCPAVFDRSIQLTNHKAKEHSEAKTCPQCNISCSSDAALEVHVTQKHGSSEDTASIAKFSCSFCPKTFPRKDKLEFHLRTHTGQKPFICSLCGKGFTRKYKLDDHEARHLGVKKYVCQNTGCDKAYASNADLKQHMRNQHPDPGSETPPPRKRLRKPKPKQSNPVIAENCQHPLANILSEPIRQQFPENASYPVESLEPIGLEAQIAFEYNTAIPCPQEEQIAGTYPSDGYFVSDTLQEIHYDQDPKQMDDLGPDINQFQAAIPDDYNNSAIPPDDFNNSAIPDDYNNFYQPDAGHPYAPDNFYNIPYGLEGPAPFEVQSLQNNFPASQNVYEATQIPDSYINNASANMVFLSQSHLNYDYNQRNTGLQTASSQYSSDGVDTNFQNFENHFQNSGPGICSGFSSTRHTHNNTNTNNAMFYSNHQHT